MRKKTTEQFIKEAIRLHGNKYDYSKVAYKNSYSKVIIICPIHGEFLQTPNEHLHGHGCPICAKSVQKKKDIKGFFEKLKEIHNDLCDYSQSEYINYHTKMLIKCKKCGNEFWQTPAKHFSGQGCPKCSKKGGIKETYTKETFLKKSKEIHKDDKGDSLYIYDEVDYKGLYDEVCIICKKHGKFWQKPFYHIHKSGCPQCAKERNKTSLEEFIKKAQEANKNEDGSPKYLYDKFIYVNSYTKGIITCPIHGDFEMTPRSHLGKHPRGCPLCNHHLPPTNEEWINKAKKIHFKFFDYSKTKFINDRTKVIITCPIHGDFEILPKKHLNSCGCPHCMKERNVLESKLYKILNKEIPNAEFMQSCYNIIPDRQELDIYSEKYKIAIEYQGAQHFQEINFFTQNKIFEHQLELDNKKIENCEKLNIKLFHFTFDKNYCKDNISYYVYTDVDSLLKEIKNIIENKKGEE